MKPLHVFRWLMSAAIAVLLSATIQTAAAHSMGGGHGGMRMAPSFSSGRGFGHFDHLVTLLFGIMAVTAFSFAIKIDSSLVLISLRFASLGGTCTPTTTGPPMVIPLITSYNSIPRRSDLVVEHAICRDLQSALKSSDEQAQKTDALL